MTAAPDIVSSRSVALAAAGVALVTFAVYLGTLAHSVTGGDTAELVAAACAGDVPHPPGYPLFTLLGRLFVLSPGAHAVPRMSLLSAMTATAAATVFFLAVRRWCGSVRGGLFAAGLFSFSPLGWSYATVAEVFALNNLLLCALLYVAVRFAEDGEARWVRWTALLCGLGASNQHALAFHAAPVAAWMIVRSRHRLAREAPKLAACLAAGLLPYLYVPWAAAHGGGRRWGALDTASGLWGHFLRRAYGTFAMGTGDQFQRSSSVISGVVAYLGHLPREMLLVGAAAVLLGWRVAFSSRSKTRELAGVLAGATALYLVLFHHLARVSVDDPVNKVMLARFWMQPNIVLLMFAGVGFAAAERATDPRVAAAGLLVPVLQLALGFAHPDRRHGDHVYRYGRALVDPLPAEALLVVKGDLQAFVLQYLRSCENVRPDVKVVPRAEAKDLRAFFDARPSGGRTFVTGWIYSDPDHSWNDAYDAWSLGYMTEVRARSAPPDSASYIAEMDRAVAALPAGFPSALAAYPPGSWEHLLLTDYWAGSYRRGVHLVRLGTYQGAERRALDKGVALLEETAAALPSPPVPLFKVLGFGYSALLDLQPGPGGPNLAGMVRAWRRYSELVGPDDEALPMIRSRLESAQK